MTTPADRIRAFKRAMSESSGARTYGPTQQEAEKMEKESDSPMPQVKPGRDSMLDKFRKRFDGKVQVSRQSIGAPMGITTIQSGRGVFTTGKRSRLSMSQSAAAPAAFSEDQFFQTDMSLDPPKEFTWLDTDFYGADQYPSFFGVTRANLREKIASRGEKSPPGRFLEIENLADELLIQCRDFLSVDERHAERVFEQIQENASHLQSLLKPEETPQPVPESPMLQAPIPIEFDVDPFTADGWGSSVPQNSMGESSLLKPRRLR